MKVQGHREGLLGAVQLVSVAVSSKDIKPVLQNIKVVAEEDRLTLLATDLELGVRHVVRAVRVSEAGDALFPAGRTQAILRESPDEELTFEVGDKTCFVRGEANEFEMASEDPADFPDFPSFSDEKYHEMPGSLLREMIRRTIFAAAIENPRYALTGVLWELEGEAAKLVATDGRRLAVAEGTATPHGGHGTAGQTHVVPTKAMQLLERTLQEGEEVVRVCLRPNEALFQTDRTVIYTRLVEGRFPPYREVFPKKQTVKINLTVGPFHAAIRQAAIMTDSETKRVSFTFGKHKLLMQTKAAKTGRSKVEMPIDYDGKDISIYFDPKYVTDMLRVLNPDDLITVELVDGNTVALFKFGSNYSYIVMPLT